jgi:ParB family transcriptional regulator, chromosome partitioning protein
MSVDKGPPRRLGRGLEALLGAAAHVSAEPGSPVRQVPIEQIRTNPYQPRKTFKAEEIAELQASLGAVGLLQPVTVRTIAGVDGYELIAGERRLRAATALGWTEIAAIVKTMDDRAALTLALVENLQRTDLNPMEEAEGYQRLVDEFHLSHQDVAHAVGKDRSTVANLLRLLALPKPVRQLLRDGKITVGHARALLAAPSERAMMLLAQNVVLNDLSVREIERRVRSLNPKAPLTHPTAPRQPVLPVALRGGFGRTPDPVSPEIRAIEDRLRAYLQTDVRVDLGGPQSGTITIRFYSNDDLDRVLELVVPPGPKHRESP